MEVLPRRKKIVTDAQGSVELNYPRIKYHDVQKKMVQDSFWNGLRNMQVTEDMLEELLIHLKGPTLVVLVQGPNLVLRLLEEKIFQVVIMGQLPRPVVIPGQLATENQPVRPRVALTSDAYGQLEEESSSRYLDVMRDEGKMRWEIRPDGSVQGFEVNPAVSLEPSQGTITFPPHVDFVTFSRTILNHWEKAKKIFIAKAFDVWRSTRSRSLKVPVFLQDTPLGRKLMHRMLDNDWTQLTPTDLEQALEPLSQWCLMKEERRMGIREPKSDTCASCGELRAKYKCTNCWLTYYCNEDCQRDHWREHKLDCVAPTCQVEQRDAVAVPDYQCFNLYRRHACQASEDVHDRPHVAVLSEEQFIRDYGAEVLTRTCLTLAATGKPYLVFMKIVVRKDESIVPLRQTAFVQNCTFHHDSVPDRQALSSSVHGR